MAGSTSETAALISPVAQPSTHSNLQPYSSSSYDTFSKPSVVSSVNQDDDTKVLSTSGHHYIAYSRRWYILLVFVLMAFLQAAAWNTWGPIADTAKPVLGWTDADIALLTNMGCITYILSAVFFSWLLDNKGLRISILVTSTLLMIGVTVRCIPIKLEYAKWTMNLGGVLIGFAGPVLAAGSPVVSATWFPQHQRTTSTALLASAAYLGVAGSFLIGPLIVTDITSRNGSRIKPVSYQSILEDIDPVIQHNHLQEINMLLYIECAAGIFLFLLTLAYYPAKPPTPPSASAKVQRKKFKKGVAILLRSRQFWFPALAYGVSAGTYNVWTTQLDTIFQHLVDVGQNTAGWIGFYSNLAGVTGCLFFARLVDYLGGKMKRVLLVMTSVAILCFIWVLLLCLEVISFNIVSLYMSCIGFSLLINATFPLYFEVTVEGVYPVAEGITTGVITGMNNLVGLCFLLVLMIPNIGIAWMNWTLFGAIVFCIPCLLLYKEKYNRLSLDTEDATQSLSSHEGATQSLLSES